MLVRLGTSTGANDTCGGGATGARDGGTTQTSGKVSGLTDGADS